ncbi:MAG: hypothetical protein WD403_09825 [Pirellulales bacterium]
MARVKHLVASWLVAWVALVAAPAAPAADERPSGDAAPARQEPNGADAGRAETSEQPAAPAGRGDQDEASASSAFLRLVRNEEGKPTAMETAIVRYVAPDAQREGLCVDLIGVVHIGEAEYYQQLNRQFEQYDALLYELVAPEGTRVPKGAKNTGNPVGALQTGMKNILELDYQLEFIDYQRDNFVHADMSPDDFARSMNERGESIWAMMFRMMGQSIAQQNKDPNRSVDAELLLALFDRNRALALKRIMAEQFQDLEGAMSAINGPDGSTIITERNKKALEVLARQIEDGKKRLAIFYGAGHMPDMEKRLLTDFGLKRQDEQWLKAWDLTGKSKKNAAQRPRKKAAVKPPARQEKAA